MATFRQIHLDNWQKGLGVYLAVIAKEPSELSAMCNITFGRDHDDLDEIEVALIEAASGTQYGLMQHRHTRGKGTLIVTSQFTESPSAALDEVLHLLGLSEADLSWRHPEVETPAAWAIWRQDDHGHKYLVQIVGFEEGARLLAARLEAAGHKQTYWVQRVESGSQAN